MFTAGSPFYAPFYNTFYKVPIPNTIPAQHAHVYPVNATNYGWPQVSINSYVATMPTVPLYHPQRQPNIWYPAYIA